MPGRPEHPGRRVRRIAAAGTLAVSLALTGCTSGSESPKAAPASGSATASASGSATSPGTTPATTPRATRTPTTNPGAVRLSPLTGLRAASSQDVARPIVAVAIAGGSTRPTPVGIASADLVYLAFPGTSRQRALALFQSRDAARAGPVDITRPMDGNILSVLGPVLTHAGGPARFIRRLDLSKLPQWSAAVHPSGFTRDSAGAYYVSTTTARSAAGARRVTAGLVSFGTAPAGPAPAPVRVAASGQPALTLSYDPKARVWNGRMGAFPIRAANVLLQQVTYSRQEFPHSGGLTEGSPDVVGSGKATVLSGPRVVPATWNRSGRATLTSFVGPSAVPVRLAPGATWVLLVPTGTPITR